MLPPTPTITPQPVGNPCFNSDQCLSGFCIDTVCCITASCPPNQFCNIYDSRGVCAPRKDLGEPCQAYQDCWSDNCGPSGICQAPLTPAPQPTPTPSPAATATLGPRPCRSSGDCNYYDWCAEPGGFWGCGTCFNDTQIQEFFHRCVSDTDCAGFADTSICEQLGLASRTCDPCSGVVSVCVAGCPAEDACALGQVCEQHRCVGSPCSNDQQCPALFTCVLAGDGGTSRCARRSCTTDTDCGDGFCVEGQFQSHGFCYSALGRCAMPPE